MTPLEYLRLIEPMPHADPLVLHAHGECNLCDKHPDWQAERVGKMVCFTGKTPEDMARDYGHWYDHDEKWEPDPALVQQ